MTTGSFYLTIINLSNPFFLSLFIINCTEGISVNQWAEDGRLWRTKATLSTSRCSFIARVPWRDTNIDTVFSLRPHGTWVFITWEFSLHCTWKTTFPPTTPTPVQRNFFIVCGVQKWFQVFQFCLYSFAFVQCVRHIRWTCSDCCVLAYMASVLFSSTSPTNRCDHWLVARKLYRHNIHTQF